MDIREHCDIIKKKKTCSFLREIRNESDWFSNATQIYTTCSADCKHKNLLPHFRLQYFQVVIKIIPFMSLTVTLTLVAFRLKFDRHIQAFGKCIYHFVLSLYSSLTTSTSPQLCVHLPQVYNKTQSVFKVWTLCIFLHQPTVWLYRKENYKDLLGENVFHYSDTRQTTRPSKKIMHQPGILKIFIFRCKYGRLVYLNIIKYEIWFFVTPFLIVPW